MALYMQEPEGDVVIVEYQKLWVNALAECPPDRGKATMTTTDMMALRSLLKKSSDADLLREMTGLTAEHPNALEVEGLAGPTHGERSSDRITHRNR